MKLLHLQMKILDKFIEKTYGAQFFSLINNCSARVEIESLENSYRAMKRIVDSIE